LSNDQFISGHLKRGLENGPRIGHASHGDKRCTQVRVNGFPELETLFYLWYGRVKVIFKSVGAKSDEIDDGFSVIADSSKY